MKKIQNPNSSKQGFAKHDDHIFIDIVTKFGYKYSHSVYVTSTLYHCFRFPGTEHSVTLTEDGDGMSYRWWQTKTTPASGRQWDGIGAAELQAHLKSKARRYGLRVPKSS